MKVSQNYLLLFTKFNTLINIVEVDACENKRVDAEFYGLKKYLYLAFTKCGKDDNYCIKWLDWLIGKQSTLSLRELFKSVGCDYWENIYNGNVIDRLDSLQFKITNK